MLDEIACTPYLSVATEIMLSAALYLRAIPSTAECRAGDWSCR